MINKRAISELMDTQDLKVLEQHLIYNYIESQGLDYIESPLLMQYLSEFKLDSSLYLNVQALEIGKIKELEKYLELLIPKGDRKLNGAFFTPDYIVNFIIKEIKPKKEDKNLDPSCGCGAFLTGLVQYYHQRLGKSIRLTIKENIFGSDILGYNIKRTKLLLTLFALQNNEVIEDTDFNLYHQDSLKADWKTKFDNIVGNPPYVKFQDLPVKSREFLSRKWETIKGGTFNLYFAFFELGYNILNTSGKLGYITPNNYFTSLAGKSIRNYFHSKKCVTRVIDFSHKKVFTAQTYTAITFIDKNKNDSILFDRITDKYSPKEFLKIANGSVNQLEDLNIKKWRLLKNDEQKNIKKIENIGTPIGQLFNICVGIATLKDAVFFIDGEHQEGKYYLKDSKNGTFRIEKEVVKSVYKISDFKNQKEAEKNQRKIIFPYKLKNGKASVIPEIEFKNQFPFCYEYLLSERKVLEYRDKGKVQFNPFYQWGRTQGLTRTGKRILNPTFSRKPRFTLITEEDSYFTNGYGLFFKKPDKQNSLFEQNVSPISLVENIDVVQKILNSILMDYYVRKTSVAIQGGYPCYQKNFIEKFTIPSFTQNEINHLRTLDKSDRIDEFLIKKYQLNLSVPNLVS